VGCELEVGRGHAGLHWDEALESGHELLAVATDDSHHPGKDSAQAVFVLDREGIVRAEHRLGPNAPLPSAQDLISELQKL